MRSVGVPKQLTPTEAPAMITGSKENGREIAILTCDTCGDKLKVAAVLGHTPDHVVNIHSVFQKAKKQGWEPSSKKVLCEICSATKREKTMTMKDEIRQPTKDQKREILGMLDAAYNVKAQRYNGSETDQSVAAALGNGIMWGWVSALREEFYGPDGNEDVELILKDVAEWRLRVDAELENVRATVGELDKAKGEIAKLVGKLNALVKK